MIIRVEVKTIDGSMWKSQGVEATQKEIDDIENLFHSMPEMLNFHILTSPSTTVYFNPAHIVAVKIIKGEEA